MTIGAKNREILHTRSCARRQRMEREQIMHCNEPATMLSVRVVEIEATRLAGKPSRFTENSVALPSYQLAFCCGVDRATCGTTRFENNHSLSGIEAESSGAKAGFPGMAVRRPHGSPGAPSHRT
jgi:hypothetical protein